MFASGVAPKRLFHTPTKPSIASARPPRDGPICRQRMPLNSLSSIVVDRVGVEEAADRTEAGKMEIANTRPTSAVTRQLGEFIRLKCEGCAFVQPELCETVIEGVGCGRRVYAQQRRFPGYALMAAISGA